MRYQPCRDFGHAWMPDEAYYDTEVRAYRRQLRCDRCSTTRRQWISTRGKLTASSYTYPLGYAREPGSGRMSPNERAEMRLAILEGLK